MRPKSGSTCQSCNFLTAESGSLLVPVLETRDNLRSFKTNQSSAARMATLWLFEDGFFFEKNDPGQKSGAESKG